MTFESQILRHIDYKIYENRYFLKAGIGISMFLFFILINATFFPRYSIFDIPLLNRKKEKQMPIGGQNEKGYFVYDLSNCDMGCLYGTGTDPTILLKSCFQLISGGAKRALI